MIAVAIAAILLAVAAPSFRDTIVRSNLDSLQDQFARAVITARTEATSRGRRIDLCPAPNCMGSNWQNGWIIADLALDTSGNVVAVTEVIASFNNSSNYPLAVTTNASTTTPTERITFDAEGINANEERYTFAVCDDALLREYVRGVIVEYSGRAVKSDGGFREQTGKFHNGETDTAIEINTLPCEV